MNAYTPTYWNHTGKYQEIYDRLWKELVPVSGSSASEAGELLRAISKIYYDYYNNGFGNGPFHQQWKLLQSYWNYVRQYVSNPKSPKIFADAFARTNYGGRVIGDDEDDFYEGDDEYESYRLRPSGEDLSAGPAEFGPDAEAAMDEVVDAVVQIAEKIYGQEEENKVWMKENVKPHAPHSAAVRKTSKMRRRHADDSQYEAVVDNADTGPGKFEGEGAVGEWVYEQSLDGWGETMGDVESEFGHQTMLIWNKPVLVREPDGEEWTFIAARVEENSQGFVEVSYYDSAAEAEKIWARLERHWEAWGQDESESEEMEAPSQEDINAAVSIYQQGDDWVAQYGTGSRRKEIFRGKSRKWMFRQLQLWAKKQNYTPDIYSVNDHGNVTAYDYDGNVVGEWV